MPDEEKVPVDPAEQERINGQEAAKAAGGHYPGLAHTTTQYKGGRTIQTSDRPAEKKVEE